MSGRDIGSSALLAVQMKRLRWLETPGNPISSTKDNYQVGRVRSKLSVAHLYRKPSIIRSLNYQQLSIIESSALSPAQPKKLRWLETSGKWSYISNNVIDRKISRVRSSYQHLLIVHDHQSSINRCPVLSVAQHHQQFSIISSLASSAAQHYKLKKLRWLEREDGLLFEIRSSIERSPGGTCSVKLSALTNGPLSPVQH